jgi:hypothetical protein
VSGDELATFLLARIGDDEATARKAAFGWGAEWRSEVDTDEEWAVVHADGKRDMVGCEDGDVTDHIARHDPARVLAECEAKRRIVEAFEDERQRKDIYNRDYPLGLLTTEGDLRARQSSNARWAGLDIAVRALAAVYASHEDYRAEWAL